VGTKAGLKDGDLACLDFLGRQGPMSPTALARAMQLHPATMTGVIDRLEGDGWVLRERDPADRRAVQVRIVRGRVRDMMGLYGGMNGAIDAIAQSYDAAQLEVISDFLARLVDAGKAANADLGDG
jgi:predicted ArsR family transcriptional regulator